MRQFYIQNRALKAIHAAVDAFHDMFALAAMARKSGHPVSQAVIVGHSATGVAVSTEVLPRIKGKGGGVTESSDDFTFVLSQVCLCTIFDDPQVMLSCDSHDGIHIGRLAVQVDWNDADSSRCDLCLDQRWINREGLRISITEDDAAPGLSDG